MHLSFTGLLESADYCYYYLYHYYYYCYYQIYRRLLYNNVVVVVALLSVYCIFIAQKLIRIIKRNRNSVAVPIYRPSSYVDAQ